MVIKEHIMALTKLLCCTIELHVCVYHLWTS